jgi:prolyl 4-hydroxylase
MLGFLFLILCVFIPNIYGNVDNMWQSLDLINNRLPKMNVRISMTPYGIYVIDQFLSDEESDWLIDYGRENLVRSTAFDYESGMSIVTNYRTSSGVWINKNTNKITKSIIHKLHKLTNILPSHMEEIHTLFYTPGEEYQKHWDYFDPSIPTSSIHLQHGGQRILTAIMYLSDVDKGGETEFINLNLQIYPKKNSILLFPSVTREKQLFVDSFHAGKPILNGTKWIATVWFRENSRV